MLLPCSAWCYGWVVVRHGCRVVAWHIVLVGIAVLLVDIVVVIEFCRSHIHIVVLSW